ncbi:MAG: hypothetical protein JWQ71_3121 [Pedosphaera sp.]|nr:hypothetical protein [Pedosphaera sp.]
MKKLTLLLSTAVAIFASLSFFTGSASAQILAQDSAAAYNTAGNTWTNGENLGFGFTPWVLTNTVNNGGNFSGFFIGDGGAIATTNNSSFGMYANGSSGANASVAYRGFTNALTTNVVFKIKWRNQGIGNATSHRGGFNLRSGNDTSDIEAGARFDFYYIGGVADSFVISDGNGANTINVPFSSGPFQLEFTLLTQDTYRFVIKDPTGTTVITNFDNMPLAGNPGDPINSLALYALQTDGNQNFNNLEISSTSLIPPVIANVLPANGSIYIAATNKVSFEANSTFSTIATSGITLTLNGVNQTLTFTGTPTNRIAIMSSALAPNLVYNATILVTDANGNHATNTFSFNTWTTNLFFIEAEDYNFSSGGFISNPFPNLFGGLNGTNGVDYFDVPDAGTNPYRPGDIAAVDAPPVSADVDHNDFLANGYSDYNLAFVSFGEWENYTRSFSNTAYNVYARMASLSGDPTMRLDRLANITATTSNQPFAALGTFICPANTGGGQGYTFVPLKDFFSSNVVIRFTGTNTVRTTRIGGGYNFNYLLFVPVTNSTTLRPYISAGYPFPSAANVGPEKSISFTIANRQGTLNTGSILLFLNASNVTSGITLSNNAAGTIVTYLPSTLLTPNSTNTVTAVFNDGGTPITNTWQFTTANAATIPPGFALPVGSGSNPGFAIHMVKADDNASPITFPPSVARAEAQLAGVITNTATSQPYPNLAAGPDGNGLFSDTNVINFDINATSTGTFPGDAAFPYIPASGTNNFFAMEALMYVQLSPGIYTFAVRSDDGFKFTTGPTPANTNLTLGIFDGGRGNDNASTFDFIVQTNGLYPMRLLYFQGEFGGNVELYSINRNDGTAILINDPNNANSIKAFQAVGSGVTPVNIVNPAHSGSSSSFNFLTQVGHTHFVEYKNTLNDVIWTPLKTISGTGSVTNVTDNTATVNTRFYRVRTQ